MSAFSHKISLIFAQPSSIFTLVGLLALIIAFLYVKRIHFTTHMLVNVSLMIALSVILHTLRIYNFPQGGSITLGDMVPLILVAFRYGPGVGFLAGFVFGIIDLIQDPFIVQPIQVLFDYPLPFMAMGLAAYFPRHKLAGATVAVFGRFVCHFISGVLFFASYAPKGMSPYWYSFAINGSILLPELIICLIILRFLLIERLLNVKFVATIIHL